MKITPTSIIRAISVVLRVSLLACVAFVITVASPLAAQNKSPQSPVLTPGQELDLRKKEIEFKSEELALKKKELSMKEQEVANTYLLENRKILITILSLIAVLIGIAIPGWIAVYNLRAQRVMAKEQAEIQFQMKVAELAMANSANSTQTVERAKALATLFETSLLPKNFGERFDPKRFKFEYGASTTRREKLIALMAEHPDQRMQMLKDWYVLFRWENWWIEPLLQSLTREELNTLKHQRDLVTANEKKINEDIAAQQRTKP